MILLWRCNFQIDRLVYNNNTLTSLVNQLQDLYTLIPNSIFILADIFSPILTRFPSSGNFSPLQNLLCCPNIFSSIDFAGKY